MKKNAKNDRPPTDYLRRVTVYAHTICDYAKLDCPMVVLEQVIDGRHDPKRSFRAEIPPCSGIHRTNSKGKQPYMAAALKAATYDGSLPIIEADRPLYPLRTPEWSHMLPPVECPEGLKAGTTDHAWAPAEGDENSTQCVNCGKAPDPQD